MQKHIKTRSESISVLNRFYDKYIGPQPISWTNGMIPPIERNTKHLIDPDPIIVKEIQDIQRTLFDSVTLGPRTLMDRHWVSRRLVLCYDIDSFSEATNSGPNQLITALYIPHDGTVAITISTEQFNIGPSLDELNVPTLLDQERRIMTQCSGLKSVLMRDVNAATNSLAISFSAASDDSDDQILVDDVPYFRYKPFAPFVPVTTLHRTDFRIESESQFLVEGVCLDTDTKNAFKNASIPQIQAICQSDHRVSITLDGEPEQPTSVRELFPSLAKLRACAFAAVSRYEQYEKEEATQNPKVGIHFSICNRRYVACKSGRVYKQ